MKKLIPFLMLAAGSCIAAPIELVNLDLSTEEAGTDLTAHPNQNAPLALPTRVNCKEGNSIRVENGIGDKKVIRLEKNRDTDSVSLAFAWPENTLASPQHLEAQFGLLLTSNAQSGNVAIALRSGNDIVAYVQISAGGLVSASGVGDIVRLGSLPMNTEIENLTVSLDYSSGEMIVSLDGALLGEPVKISTELTPKSLTISSSSTSEQTNRTVAFHKITVTANGN